MKDELKRRDSLTDAVEAYFRAHPNTWLSMADLSKVGGLGGFRTRISDCRIKRGMHIENNRKNGARSAYRFLPYVPLARDAGTYVEQSLPGMR
jgi:hypothetical protein